MPKESAGREVALELDLWSAAPITGSRAPIFRLVASDRVDEFGLPVQDDDDDDEPAPRVFTPRPYQTEAIEAVWRGFRVDKPPKRRQLGIAATGAGKTSMFVLLAKRFLESDAARKPKTLILTDQADLIDQTVAAARTIAGFYADVEQGPERASRQATMVVATVQTMKARLDEWPVDHFDLVVADECDRALTKGWTDVLEHFGAFAQILGVTATPKRMDKRSVLRAFEHKAFEIGTYELINKGYLAPIVAKTAKLPIDLRKVATTAGDFSEDEVAAAIEEVFLGVIATIKKLAAGRRTMVFLPRVETSKKFAALCNANGLTADHIDGSMGKQKRKFLKQAFRERQFDILCNPCLLGRGFDDPGVNCIINLRATKSDSLYQQIVGRGTRLYCPHGCPGKCDHPDAKKDVLILDFLWQFNDRGPLGPADLIAESREEAEQIRKFLAERGDDQAEMDLRDVVKAAKRNAEKALLEAFINGRNARKEYLRADVWAAKMGLHEWVNWEPETDAQDTPMTGAQMKELIEKGFMIDTVRGGFHAAFILEQVTAQRRAKKASFKQAWWLWQKGHPNAHNYTLQEASRHLGEIFGDRKS